MTELTPIQTLDNLTVRAALQRALLLEDPVRAVSDFLLSIDWSSPGGTVRADEVAALLDEAEAITTAAEEGDVSVDRFVMSIRQLASNQTIGGVPSASGSSAVTIVIPSPPPRSTTLTLQAVG